MNPHLSEISIGQNYLKRGSSTTYQEMILKCPDKIKKLNLKGSLGLGHHLNPFISDLTVEMEQGLEIQKISVLDLSNMNISTAGCKIIGQILIIQKCLRTLDL